MSENVLNTNVTASHLQSTVENESRSYNPYLIEYHEETNTFTYNDPWIAVDLPKENGESQGTTQIEITKVNTEIVESAKKPDQEIHIAEKIVSDSTTEINLVTSDHQIPSISEKRVEFLPEVSFPSSAIHKRD